ncbi:uncharacterized protein BJX67DRAFT_212050 [Aspergillus lucknowensis]|uniref:C2H2-type domain-containing protein n=1 Tax=Aspergillus lucknowensis TaxID=176173 RepID=A0ABR4M2C9_9EURO
MSWPVSCTTLSSPSCICSNLCISVETASPRTIHPEDQLIKTFQCVICKKNTSKTLDAFAAHQATLGHLLAFPQCHEWLLSLRTQASPLPTPMRLRRALKWKRNRFHNFHNGFTSRRGGNTCGCTLHVPLSLPRAGLKTESLDVQNLPRRTPSSLFFANGLHHRLGTDTEKHDVISSPINASETGHRPPPSRLFNAGFASSPEWGIAATIPTHVQMDRFEFLQP